MTLRFINRPCQLVTRTDNGVVDVYGDRDDTLATVSTVCELQVVPRIGLESEREDGNIGYDSYKVYLPADIQPGNNAALVIDGETYEFTGPTNTQRNPRTGLDIFTEGFVRRTS